MYVVCYECAPGRGLLILLNGLNKDQRKLNNKFYDASLQLRWNYRQIIWVWIPPNSICKEVTLEISSTTSARRPTTLQPISIYLHFNFLYTLSLHLFLLLKNLKRVASLSRLFPCAFCRLSHITFAMQFNENICSQLLLSH